ncbi:hypothetical protein ACJJTC_019358 [Scirpophaga incertulas]
MSETDDTDVLLLIPPNFFLVNTSGSEESLLESSRTVVHKPASCTAQVIGKLVNQVHSLESRLSNLEINSTRDTCSSVDIFQKHTYRDTIDSIDSISLDSKYFTFPRRRRRKVSKKRQREWSITSLDTATTGIPRLQLENYIQNKINLHDSRSMDGDISSIVSTPSKRNDKLLLNEIDEFLTKVEAYETPESKYKDHNSDLSIENVIKATGDYMANKFDSNSSKDEVTLPSGRIVTSSVLDKYIYLVKNQSDQISQGNRLYASNSIRTNHNSCTTPQETNETVMSKPDMRSPATRRLNFSESKDVQPTSTPKRTQPPSTSHSESFQPSSNKIFDRANKVLEQYKNQNNNKTLQTSAPDTAGYARSPKKEFKLPTMRPYTHENKESGKLPMFQNKLMDTIDTDLLSLSDLWGEKGDKLDRGDSLKLEEERLKREHCEAMIQQLQKKILDQQEKLAVAMRVDRTKDTAITKLKEAWLKITSSLDKAEDRHRQALEKMVLEVDNFKLVADEAQKKTNHFEAELYKALDLAHDYQDKCKQVVSEKKQHIEVMEKALSNQRDVIANKDKEIQMLKDNYDTVMKLNKQSTDCVKNIEDTLAKEKSEHDFTKSKAKELEKRIESMNDELSILLKERDILKAKVNEERSRSNILERQLCEKQNQSSELFKKCDMLDTEVKTLRKQLEIQRNELKLHYQKQLEDAVLAKLQEFQRQLDVAEKEIESDARNKEAVIVDGFNKQIAKIEEQHKLEVNLLEEKQREEINLYRLQLAQASEKIGLLESKLESYRQRRATMAGQLHGVMQAQWRQALRILTASNVHPGTAPTASNVHPAASSIAMEPSVSTQVQSRPSRSDLNFEGLSDGELQQYVKLLLTKSPNFEGSGDGHGHEAPTTDRHDSRARLDRHDRHDRQDRVDRRDGSNVKRTANTLKPPWRG